MYNIIIIYIIVRAQMHKEQIASPHLPPLPPSPSPNRVYLVNGDDIKQNSMRKAQVGLFVWPDHV